MARDTNSDNPDVLRFIYDHIGEIDFTEGLVEVDWGEFYASLPEEYMNSTAPTVPEDVSRNVNTFDAHTILEIVPEYMNTTWDFISEEAVAKYKQQYRSEGVTRDWLRENDPDIHTDLRASGMLRMVPLTYTDAFYWLYGGMDVKETWLQKNKPFLYGKLKDSGMLREIFPPIQTDLLDFT